MKVSPSAHTDHSRCDCLDSGPGDDAGPSDAGVDAGAPDAGPSCPCFGETELAFIEALGGDRTCVVDVSAGGTTQTALVESFVGERVVAEAPVGMDGTHYCGYGCLADAPGGPCGRAPAHSLMPVADMSAWMVCHDLIAAHCP